MAANRFDRAVLNALNRVPNRERGILDENALAVTAGR